jgi:hypothetical protein
LQHLASQEDVQMMRLSFSWIVTVAVGSFAIRAQQCPPATSHEGFHQENVGHSLAAQGDEALFGHLSGFVAGFHERRGNDAWWRTSVMGGSGSGPVRMGYTVALRGDIAAAGDAWDHSLPGFSTQFPNGAAVVFERTAGVWSRITDLYPTTTTSTYFGIQVAIADDGSLVLVGASQQGAFGAVHVYARQPSGWVLAQTITGASLSPPGAIGGALATGGHLFVPVHSNPNPTVRTFTQQGGTWTETGSLALATTYLGGIAVDGQRVVVGAPQQPNIGSAATGAVFEYDLSLPNWASQPTVVTPPPGSTAIHFGRSLDLDGDRLAIGANNQAFEYRRVGGTWQPFASVQSPAPTASSDFARSVALYTNGLLVGDPYFDTNPLAYPHGTGGVHTFDFIDLGQPFQGCGRGVALEWGGPLRCEIDWPQQAGKSYHVFGSLGLGPTPVGGITIPLTPDVYTDLLLANPQLLAGGSGTLNGNGRATVTWLVPTGLPLWWNGAQFHHAVVAWDATSLAASNAVTSRLIRFF